MSPKFTVIIPIYNLERLVERSLASVKAQTFADFECIVVNDGSADASGAVCEQFAAKDARFSVLHQQNGGVSSARNLGMEYAKSNNIVFLDGDDTLEPFALEWIAHKLQLHPTDLIGWGLRGENDAPSVWVDAEPRVMNASQRVAYSLSRYGVNVSNRLFFTDIIKAHNLQFDTAMARGEDGDFANRYHKAFFDTYPEAHVFHYSTILYVYFDDNTVNRASQKKVEAHEVEWDPESAKGYAARIMKEHTAAVDSMQGYENMLPEDQVYTAIQFARRFAYAVWCANKLGEALPEGFFGAQGTKRLTDAMKSLKVYNAYYWPLKLQCKPLICAMYQSDASESKKLYWKVFLVGDILLARRWRRL